MKSMPSRMLIGAVVAVVGLSGCVPPTNGGLAVSDGSLPQTQTDKSTAASKDKAPPESFFNKFTDIPIPEQFTMDTGNTLILGSGENWVGRLIMSAPYRADKMYDFFKREFPGFGWQELTSVRAKTSILAYQRANRVATVQIESTPLRGTDVVIVMSPRGQGKTGTLK